MIRPLLKGRVALQGNLDPATMHASDEVGADWSLLPLLSAVALLPRLSVFSCVTTWQAIQQGVAKMMAGFGPTGHIANLGHGMTPTMEPR